MKKFLFFSLMVSLLAFASFGCKPDNAATNAGSKPAVQTSQKAFAEITDSEKRNVVLAKKPERADRKSTRLNSSHPTTSRMPSSA